MATWQRLNSAQRAPRQLSRVEVTCGQIGCESDRPATSARSPLRVVAGPALERAPTSCPRVLFQRQSAPAACCQAIAAEIVGAAFEQAPRVPGRPMAAATQRQVLGEELILQRARARRDEHALARQQGRHQYAKVLPVPVPASTTRASRFVMAPTDRSAIRSCWRRKRKSGSARCRGPSGPKISSRSSILGVARGSQWVARSLSSRVIIGAMIEPKTRQIPYSMLWNDVPGEYRHTAGVLENRAARGSL